MTRYDTEREFLRRCARRWDRIAMQWEGEYSSGTASGICFTLVEMFYQSRLVHVGRVPSLQKQLAQSIADIPHGPSFPWVWPKTEAYRGARAVHCRRLARRCRTLAAS